jgi:4-diphosphocytidyl-2-C-methyl-D-erythritol kinase
MSGVAAVNSAVVFAPAKINLFLAVTGRRADGFHDLVSVVAPLAWGDTLWVESEERKAGSGKQTTDGGGRMVEGGKRKAESGEIQPNAATEAVTGGDGITLECDEASVPCDETNLIVKAARLFREATGWRAPVHFRLEKRIPMGAGLGGGSSDATAALRGLDLLAGHPLAPAKLAELAARVGSDCALFLHDAPVVMRGRGEHVERLPADAAARLRGRRVLVFKPNFGIGTPWAYQRLAAEAPASYVPAAGAEARLAAWLADPSAPAEQLLGNNLERPAFAKFLALPTLLGELRTRFALAPQLSGSGSACFALLPDNAPVPDIAATIRAAWGEAAFVLETRFS